MMGRKTQHNSHCSYSPKNGASVRRRAPVEGAHYDNFAALGKRNRVSTLGCGVASRGRNVTLFHSGTRMASPADIAQPARDVRPDTALRSAGALEVRSTVSREGVCSWANRARCRLAGQGEREERSFFESRRAPTRLDLVSRASRCGPTSPRPFSPSAPDARSAQPISTSAAIASPPMKRSWSCLTNCGRASGRNLSRGRPEGRAMERPFWQSAGELGSRCYAATDKRCRAPRPVDLCNGPQGRTEMAGVSLRLNVLGVTAPSASAHGEGIDSRRSEFGAGIKPGPRDFRTPERKITASPRRSIAVVGTDGAASAGASQPSYLLAHGDPASVQGGEQGRLFARTTGDNSELVPPGLAFGSGIRYRARRHQRELLAPRLRRESGGVTPTAQKTRAIEGRRAEVQGCAAIVEGRGRRSTESQSESNQRQGRNGWGWMMPPRKTIHRRNGVVSRRGRRGAVCARGDEPRATIHRRAA